MQRKGEMRIEFSSWAQFDWKYLVLTPPSYVAPELTSETQGPYTFYSHERTSPFSPPCEGSTSHYHQNETEIEIEIR